MSFGKLYTKADGNVRSTAIRAVAKLNNLDLEIVDIVPGPDASADYLKLNRLGKIPTFVGSDGYILSECIAIAIYITSQNEKTTLLGKTKQDYASILRWMSFANGEVLPQLGNWWLPIIGRAPFNKKVVDEAQAATLKRMQVLDSHLLINTYLVGDRLTLADLFVTGCLLRGFQNFFDKKFREQHPNLTRWYETVYNQPAFSEVSPEFVFIETALPNQPPKKEPAPAKEKKEQPKKAAPKQVEEEDAPPAPKPKHPIEELGRATFALDDWKRKYSNEETREVALPWFWENMKFDEYSIWRVDYKYNDELTMTFMSNNLVGGFFNRLEASRKYLFGAASVYGETNNSIIRGAFVVRGQEALPAFDVAPDYESYEFTKLDPSKPEDREFVDDMWAWDKPIEANGQTYAHSDGKVFK
ncbi:eEF1-gamma domain-containing protein [Eremomyces bilateralis CBS 781.70]|uniref:EEF1-gamma domain-containing protein n=1 Tax=Eremomyces bilateralis CBS 781.70 TaxID=1392243 RepID=A0A6G1G017_9PEZI|nr:eEF1-gamma domain-containing protein [Eremomyces bilateralis CBS 781.70]KAF1811455.1 eEF1-gamma domain-containing protein [Eremomyces bilateralis CBS 781.70]